MIAGNARFFSAGADLTKSRRYRRGSVPFRADGSAPMAAARQLSAPTIAVIQGYSWAEDWISRWPAIAASPALMRCLDIAALPSA